MVTLALRPAIEEPEQALEEKVTLQVAEIMEAAHVEGEQGRDSNSPAQTWKYSMPFAGVRYFSYD